MSGPAANSHFVQFYEQKRFLCESVARFFAAGLDAGDRLLLIAEPEHANGILSELGQAVAEGALQRGQLTIVDAREFLDTLLVGGVLDEARVRTQLQRLMLVTRAYPGARLRAFGEMVNLLLRGGNASGALRLEEMWNELAQVHDVALLCAYDFDHFPQQRDGARFDQICRLHTHVIPAEGFARLTGVNERLREVSTLQQRARALENEVRQRQAVEGALRELLERRAGVEAELRASLEREQAERSRAHVNDAFKEALMGILGQDLRDPLHTVLTTARCLTSRADLPGDSRQRLERVVSGGMRMQRMLEQLLDLARDRLAAGISVSRTAPRDLAPLVAKIVEDSRLAHPEHRFELRGRRSCMASVDADRFEQVVCTLLGNAATHGDTALPIQVAIQRSAGEVTLSVRNHGRPIPADLLPLLFDPARLRCAVRKAGKLERRSEGLGLGLYICERILRAHGGSLRVESSKERGTLFEATFPHELAPELDAEGSA